MASQKTVTQDRDVILRIGYNGALTGTSDNPIAQSLSAQKPDGSTDVLVDGWRVINVRHDTDEDRKKAIMLKPFILKVTRRSPNVVIKKGGSVTETQVEVVINLLKASADFIDMNDPKQWDRYSDVAIGRTASRPWFFEDMRKTRDVKMGSAEETIAINEALVGMYGNIGKMRDSLFLIGVRPNPTDTEKDLKYALYENLIENNNTIVRRKFLDMFVHKGYSPQQLEAKKWFEKGLSYDLITNNNGVFISGVDRLGLNEDEVISTIIHRDDIRGFLIQSISSKSQLEEDKVAATAVIKSANEALSGDEIDETLGVNYIKGLAKELGVASNPGPMFSSCRNIEEAVKKFNEKLRAMNIPDPKYISVESVREQISAKS